jgi:hypothetical protein
MNPNELPAYGGPRDGGFIRAEVIPNPGQAIRVESRYRYLWDAEGKRFVYWGVATEARVADSSSDSDKRVDPRD